MLPSPTTSTTTRPVIIVTPSQGASLDIAIRGHRLVADQPGRSSGDERGPQPLEIFVSGLAACVATDAASYLRRHGIGTAGLEVSCSYDVGDHPTRVTSIRVAIAAPPHLPEERRAALLAMARHCTAHNTLLLPPHVEIGWELDEAQWSGTIEPD